MTIWQIDILPAQGRQDVAGHVLQSQAKDLGLNAIALSLAGHGAQVPLGREVRYEDWLIETSRAVRLARALGETAPLLMIGMVAFIADVPTLATDPATVMPVQIYLWASSPEIGFVQKTAAAILVLLVILLILNVAAVWLRNRFERRW